MANAKAVAKSLVRLEQANAAIDQAVSARQAALVQLATDSEVTAAPDSPNFEQTVKDKANKIILEETVADARQRLSRGEA